MKKIMAWMATAATLTFVLPGALPGAADQNDPHLGDLFRRLEAEFCAEVARLTGDRSFARAADVLLDCANAWSRLATYAAADQLDWRALVVHAEQLPSSEQRAVQALEEAASP